VKRKHASKSVATSGVEKKQSGTSAYLLLIFYLFLIFFRPFDLVPSLKVLHLPMVTGGLCLFTYVATRFAAGRPIFPLTPVTKVLAAMTVWVLITVPFAFWIHGSLQGFWNDWCKMVILFFLLANVLQSAENAQRAIWVCVLGATGVSVIAVALKVLLGESVSEGRLVSDASGLYSGPNFFSMTLILLLPYALFFFFLHRRILIRIFAGFVVAAFTVANMMTESRTGMVGEILVVIMAFWMLREWGVSLVKTAGFVLLAALLFLPLAPKGLWDRFSTVFGSYDINKIDRNSAAGSALGSEEQRKELLVRALIMTAENPVFGVGMNNFPSASHERFNTGAEDWLGCHNTFLQISSELGVPGLVIYLALLYAAWKTIRSTKLRLSREETELPEARQLRLLNDATMISLAGYILFSTFAHLGYQPYFFWVAGIGQGLSNISMRLVPASAPVTSLATATAT
jgi:O-antigen ligase